MAKTNRYFNKTDQKEEGKPGKLVKSKENAKKVNKKEKTKLVLRTERKHILKPLKIPKTLLKKYEKGPGVEHQGLKTKFHQKLWNEQDRRIKKAIKQTARTEVLLNEQTGFIEFDGNEEPASITQSEIVSNVDISAATKHFQLNLNEFGPYRHSYTGNGRYLLLGGKKGHIAAIDWITKGLQCEINVMEEIADVSWLHQETLFAVAQKSYVHIYDNKVFIHYALTKITHII